MHSKTSYAFVDLVKLCSFTGPGFQIPVVAKRVYPTFANSLGNRLTKPARGVAFEEEIPHGGVHLGHTGATDADVVWIPTKVLRLDVTAQAILRTKVGRFGCRRHLRRCNCIALSVFFSHSQKFPCSAN